MTDFNDIDESIVMKMKTPELLNYLDMMDDIELETYHQIRFGINIKFDLVTFLNGSFRYKPDRGIMRIQLKDYPESDVWTEIRERDKMMRKEIINRIKDDNITKTRK